ncbi:Hypothetical protein, putative [Bodo saltans]|uniref:Ubiquitin-like domain-containing protein n=1 Tax=Bodo saltans TaxID=75058 RepID=A0A0S4IYR4_BODSA|nr:Hypothetical protein, putative [Bodo saltans]|eukprot:CUG12666.1 Hypothetical protein, putative [Bodo saltans]
MSSEEQQQQYTEEQQQQQYEDGDDHYSSEDEWSAPAKPLPETSAAAQSTDVRIDALDEAEREAAGDVVPVVFVVPASGESFRMSFMMGHTVAHIKAKIEDIKSWPYERIILKLNGKFLLDPLSLNDLPFQAQVDNTVEVTFTPEQ